ncbi:MAG: superoxide dismutase family protein [Lachnospiraceae bacterium]|nr:superoxide dismutase family protein [Lachnospiraceae bacterium]
MLDVLEEEPNAEAIIKGSTAYPKIRGIMRMYQTMRGVLVATEVVGLPYSSSLCEYGIFGFHIHKGEHCTGNESDPFADVKMHYNPYSCEHPNHKGDLPSLFGNRGYALSVFVTERFHVEEVIGKTVIIHSKPDDFGTQPSGNAGEKIACGEIKKL